jgi:hypothetical protein
MIFLHVLNGFWMFVFCRAFYGWLAHCRHLRTVRKHLGGLAFEEPIIMEDQAWSQGITEEWWTKNFLEGNVKIVNMFFNLTD